MCKLSNLLRRDWLDGAEPWTAREVERCLLGSPLIKLPESDEKNESLKGGTEGNENDVFELQGQER